MIKAYQWGGTATIPAWIGLLFSGGEGNERFAINFIVTYYALSKPIILKSL